MHPWAVAARIAEQQHLVVTTWQLKLLGISARALAHRVQKQGWYRPARGVIALPGPVTPIRRLAVAVLMYSCPVEGLTRAQALIDDGGGVTDSITRAALEAGQKVCGLSALWLHGIEDEPEYDWIRVPEHAGHQPRAGVKLRYGAGSGETVWIQGLPAVDVVQGVFDAAGSHPGPARRRHHDLVRWISRGDALRKVTLDEVGQRLAADARFVGKPAVRDAVADLRGSLSHSETEAKARRLAAAVMARYGLRLEPRRIRFASMARSSRRPTWRS